MSTNTMIDRCKWVSRVNSHCFLIVLVKYAMKLHFFIEEDKCKWKIILSWNGMEDNNFSLNATKIFLSFFQTNDGYSHGGSNGD